MKTIQREPNYDLAGGAAVLDKIYDAQAASDKCTIEIIGTDMVGQIGFQISVSEGHFEDVADCSLVLSGSGSTKVLSGITPGSFILVKVTAGTSGVLQKINYLFG